MNEPFKPLIDSLTISKSQIDGLGLFSVNVIPQGLKLGVSHVKDERFRQGYIRTPLGGFINHSDSPNCILLEVEDLMYIQTTQTIESNTELTLNYHDSKCGVYINNICNKK